MSNQERLLPIGILEQSKKNQLKPAFEEGEFFLADYFNKKLPLDWTIFTRPEFKGRWGSNQSKKTPDLVLAHPKKGIMIFEVKNWNISNFFSEETETKYGKVLDIFQKNDKGRSGNKNPVLQAETYLWRMRDNVHEILEEIYENQNKRFLIRCGVYFHNPYSTDQARNFVKYNKFVNPDRCSVFAKDLLDSDSSLEQIMPLINNKFKINTDRDWLQSFKNWISPPLHRQEKQFRLSINDLDNNQKNFVLSKPNVVQKLSGVAGSGKTTIAALRASLSANENKKVLVLCYNITIKNFIKDEVERTIYIEKERIDFFHFHDFCKVYRENNNIIYPNSLDEEENDDKSVEEIIEHKIKNLDKSINYDVIIIDEGQDFKKNWYDLIRNFLNIDGEILIAIDQKQNIYRRKETALKGIGSGRWGILKKSYRLLNQHIELANKFSDNFLKNFKDDLETPAIDVEVNNQINLPFKAEPGSYWRNINNKKELNDFLIKIINDLFEKKLILQILQF